MMRIVNVAIYGFIIREQSALMTIDRFIGKSFEAGLNKLLMAIEH